MRGIVAATARWVAGTPLRRTLLGVAVAVAWLPAVLLLTACVDLKTPVGDPEQGWADERISGAWIGADEENPERLALWIFEPWDRRTWLLHTSSFTAATPSEGGVEAGPARGEAGAWPAQGHGPRLLAMLVDARTERSRDDGSGKAWLTTLGGRRFLVLEERGHLSSRGGFQPSGWLVFRVQLDGDRLLLTMPDDRALGEATTRWQAEQIIARRADDPGFYAKDFAMNLHRVPRSAWDSVRAAWRKEQAPPGVVPVEPVPPPPAPAAPPAPADRP